MTAGNMQGGANESCARSRQRAAGALTPIRLGLMSLALISLAVSAATTQVRTYNPISQKFIAGFGDNPWGYTNLICGIRLEADCYGRWEAYVRETTPGAKAICAALMSAQAQQISVKYHLDVTNSGQCEIVRVES